MHRIQKPISEFVSGEPVPAIEPADPVTVAMDIMKSNGSDCVLIIDHGELVGIFTERDFLYRVAAVQGNPSLIPIAEVMTREPVSLKPRDSIAYAINCMVTRGFRNIPVIDDAGRVLSVLDVRDVIAHISEVFAELEEIRATDEPNEWTDIGGGD